jgi:hypothetical protein
MRRSGGKGCNMHDILGHAGMLRGWVAVWTMQLLWLLASLTIAVGGWAIVESMVSEYRRRRTVKLRPAGPAALKS